jgi:hypothetical protein
MIFKKDVMHNEDIGLDEQGFIRNDYSVDKIQPEFKPVVDSVVQQLTQRFPEQIDGIYLYGSVPRGTAVVGRSDLDVSIILNTPITESEQRVFQELSTAIPDRHPEISKIDIDPGYLNNIQKPEELYYWQFWLKHCCCCVWGNDRAISFVKHQPKLSVALALNGDLSVFLDQMAGSFSKMDDEAVAKIIGKKLVRAAYYFIAAKDGSWYIDLSQCTQAAKEYYPNQQHDIELAYLFASGALTSKTDAMKLYQRLSGKINEVASEARNLNSV